MVDLIYIVYFLVALSSLILFMLNRKKVKGQYDYTSDSPLGFINARKPQVIIGADYDGFAEGAVDSPLDPEVYDIHLDTGHVIRDATDANFLPSTDPRGIMFGTSSMLCNITKNGDVVDWGGMFAQAINREENLGVVEHLKRKLANAEHYGKIDDSLSETKKKALEDAEYVSVVKTLLEGKSEKAKGEEMHEGDRKENLVETGSTPGTTTT